MKDRRKAVGEVLARSMSPVAATAAALDQVLASVQAGPSKGAVRRLGGGDALDVAVVSTGVPSLDRAIGVGGYPRGRIIEVFGLEAAGKTSLVLLGLAEAQKSGLVCAFVDVEHALSPAYAARLGVDLDQLAFGQPDSAEAALQLVEDLVDAGAQFVIVDSVAALVPQAEIDGEMGASQIGLQARLMGQAMRKLTPKVSRSGAIVVFINQIRQKVGVTFGSPDVTTGGNALKFYASVRLDIRRVGSVKRGDVVVGTRSRVKVVKNKVAQPFGFCEVEFTADGFDRPSDLVALGIDTGVVVRSGAWLEFAGQKWQGAAKMAEAVGASPELAAALQAAL